MASDDDTPADPDPDPDPGPAAEVPLDLRPLLDAWPHRPGRIDARRLDGADGRPLLQVRIELGVVQMELEGRPDGRPSVLDELEAAAASALPADLARSLREEIAQHHHRAVALFALEDWPAVIADCERNLAAARLGAMLAASPEGAVHFTRVRPGVLTLRTRARAESAVAARRPSDALGVLEAGIGEVRAALVELGGEAAAETSGDLRLLEGMRDALVPRLPSSQRAELEARLAEALENENYELAAILRDELRQLD